MLLPDRERLMTNSSSLFKLRIYPSGDFSIGANHPPKADKSESATKFNKDSYREFWNQKEFIDVETDERLITENLRRKFFGRLAEPKICALFNAYEKEYLDAVESGDSATASSALSKIERLTDPEITLGLSDAPISHKRSKRGLGGITPYGKRMVRSGAVLLEKEHQRQFLSFGTATIPSVSKQELELICHSWADLTRKFFQEICRGLERYGLPPRYVQVTEIQSARFTNLDFLGLHLHWVMPGRKRGHDWCFKPEDIKALWQRLLENLLGRPVDCTAATRIETPKKTLHGELSKYMTKGVDIIQAAQAAGLESMLPSAWWGSAKPLKTQIKSLIIERSGLAAYWLDKHLEDLKASGVIWYVSIWLHRDGKDIRLGAVGRFNDLGDIRDIMKIAESYTSSDVCISK